MCVSTCEYRCLKRTDEPDLPELGLQADVSHIIDAARPPWSFLYKSSLPSSLLTHFSSSVSLSMHCCFLVHLRQGFSVKYRQVSKVWSSYLCLPSEVLRHTPHPGFPSFLEPKVYPVRITPPFVCIVGKLCVKLITSNEWYFCMCFPGFKGKWGQCLIK